MQRGSLIRSVRKHGPDVWQFRWSETGGDGRRVYRKRVIGTMDQYSDAVEARRIATGILAMPGHGDFPIKPASITIAELSQHFQHRELAHADSWRSYSTRRNYIFYLGRWIIPRWGSYTLGQVRTIEVESWPRGLPLALNGIQGYAGAFAAFLFAIHDRHLHSAVTPAKRAAGDRAVPGFFC